MEAYTCIYTRQSIREYDPQKQILEKDFQYLLKAASRAPSGGNAQPWFFYIVRNPKIIEQMRKTILQVYPHNEKIKRFGTFFNAPYVIAACLDIRKRWYHRKNPQLMIDIDDFIDNPDPWAIAAAIQNLLLAAHSIGIGTCWTKINRRIRVKLEKLLKIKSYHRLIANIAIGYYKKKPSLTPRRPLKEIYTFID